MRPRSLDEFAGQHHLLGAKKIISELERSEYLPSLIFWGPPGSGKTTLARLLASGGDAYFTALSAVSAGVKDIRAVVAEARQLRHQYDRATILFLDEIHRFSKSQQDALLPHVETGAITLFGATTENPSFEVNGALLSRCRVVRLESLGDDDLQVILRRALDDTERGLGGRALQISDEDAELTVSLAGGDARRLLGIVELAASMTPDDQAISRSAIEEAAQQRMLSYDKAGAEHYGVVSAFIKSMRGSDPDAAAYWLTRMLEAGEDPSFVLRRMIIFASEDVGNADPQALPLAMATLDSFRFIGLPEGVLPLTQLAVYLACAPKSNTALSTYIKARKVVRERGALPVPKKLLNAVSATDRAMGHGRGYKYPHDFAGSYVVESYLPEALEGTEVYTPRESGYEATMAARLRKWRNLDSD